MRYWVGVTSALGVGGLLGFVAGMATVEKKLRKEYEEAAESRRRAFELAERLRDQSGVKLLEDVEFLDIAVVKDPLPGMEFEKSDANVYDPSGQSAFTPETQNPYHKAVAADETKADIFTAGGVNDYGMSYLEEEEFMEEDGRMKYQVSLVFDNGEPHFFMDGEKIDDWDVRMGDSIVVDFIKYTSQSSIEVLYVRNHKTDEDYEVALERP